VKNGPSQQQQSAAAAAAQGERPFDFAAQYQASYRLLWLIAAGILGGSYGADDVVQEAAVQALTRIDQFTPGTNFVAWMAQTVRYVGFNHARKRRRSRSTSLESADAESPKLSYEPPESGDLRLGRRGEIPAGQRHFDDRIMRALEGIGEVPRSCLLLRTVEGMEYSEIARLLGIPEGTAMSHVHRSRQYLRRRLMEDETGKGASAAGRNGVRGGLAPGVQPPGEPESGSNPDDARPN
jgi:RNA polymerase sigma-70 factor (ECF subfamily)